MQEGLVDPAGPTRDEVHPGDRDGQDNCADAGNTEAQRRMSRQQGFLDARIHGLERVRADFFQEVHTAERKEVLQYRESRRQEYDQAYPEPVVRDNDRQRD